MAILVPRSFPDVSVWGQVLTEWKRRRAVAQDYKVRLIRTDLPDVDDITDEVHKPIVVALASFFKTLANKPTRLAYEKSTWIDYLI